MNKKDKDKDKDKDKGSVIVTHHEARRDYFILESLEAGIVLEGCEVKSLRDHKANLAGSFARVDGKRMLIYNLYIAPYVQGNRENPESPTRERELLLHRSQIDKLRAKTQEKGLTLVPLKLYFTKTGIVKVELGVAKGKKAHDRRADIKERTAKREIDRAIKNRNMKN